MIAEPNRAHPLSQGLVLAMPFDGYGLTTYDISGRQNNGVFSYLTSATYLPSWDKGPDGTTIKFVRNGTGDGSYIDCGNSSLLNGVSGLSFCARVMHVDFSGTGNENGICGRDKDAVTRSFFFYAGLGGALKLQINGTDQATGQTLVADVWYTLGFTGSPAYGWQVFVNGAGGAIGSWVAPNATTCSTTIGPREYPSNQGFMNGYMSSACFWDRLLSPNEMAMLARDPLVMLRPRPWNWRQAAAGGGGGDAVPQVWAQYRRRRTG